MRQPQTESIVAGAKCKALSRSAAREIVTLALLLGLVTSALSGCILVPVPGWGHGPGHGHEGRGYYRQG